MHTATRTALTLALTTLCLAPTRAGAAPPPPHASTAPTSCEEAFVRVGRMVRDYFAQAPGPCGRPDPAEARAVRAELERGHLAARRGPGGVLELGPPYRIRILSWSPPIYMDTPHGSPLLDSGLVLPAALQPGAPARLADLRAGLDELAGRYRAEGYLLATATPRITVRPDARIDLGIDLDLGPLADAPYRDAPLPAEAPTEPAQRADWVLAQVGAAHPDPSVVDALGYLALGQPVRCLTELGPAPADEPAVRAITRATCEMAAPRGCGRGAARLRALMPGLDRAQAAAVERRLRRVQDATCPIAEAADVTTAIRRTQRQVVELTSFMMQSEQYATAVTALARRPAARRVRASADGYLSGTEVLRAALARLLDYLATTSRCESLDEVAPAARGFGLEVPACRGR